MNWRWPAGIISSRRLWISGSLLSRSSDVAGMTMSTAYGRSATCSSIHVNSISSWSGVRPESPQHSNAPGLGDRGHDVTAMAEGEDRKIGADLPGEGCSHFFSLAARPRGRAGSSHLGGRLRSGL